MLDIYVGNLPASVSVEDLRELFAAAPGHRLSVTRKGLGMAALWVSDSWAQHLFADIHQGALSTEPNFTLVEDEQGRFARYCRVSGYSRSSVALLITQLAGVGLQGRVLEIRPFQPRNLSNDRRRAGWHFRRWLGIEGRRGERRHRH